MLRELIDDVLFRLGYIPERELILRALPAEKQKRARRICTQLGELRTLNNPGDAFALTSELGAIFKESAPDIKSKSLRVKDAVRMIGGDTMGYRPAMARLYGLFNGNPFGIYSFVARHHWAVRVAMQVIRDELVNDGFELIGQQGTTKKRLKDVYKQLKKMNVFDLRIDVASHIKLFGNAWILPHKNLMGGPAGLELLAPPRLMPIIDPMTDQIIGWEYTVGRTTFTYPKDKIFQLYQYTIDNYKELGDPPLTPAILLIEADLAGESYTNQQMQRGGFMGLILNMKTSDSDPISRDEDDIVEDLQDKIDAQFSGVKAAQSVLVTNNLDKAVQLKPPIANVFDLLHQQTAKTVAQCLGVPPEKIAISRSSTLQYIPSLVEDSVNSQFDKSINALTSLVDDFLNEKVLKEMLGITDVRIVATGRYGALTKNAADTIKVLADSGPLITVNQALDRILGWKPLAADNPRGNYILDNSVNRDAESVPVQSEQASEDPNFGKSHSQMRGGQHERVEKTSADDSDRCTIMVVKMGTIQFYE